jgi:hypothetical protein
MKVGKDVVVGISPEDALGEALAGVTLGSSQPVSFASSSPFSIAHATNGNANDGVSTSGHDGWGTFTNSSPSTTVASTTTSRGMGVEDTSSTTSSRIPIDTTTARNEGLDLFLSQSPSQTLGNDVFKFGSHTNLPSLAEEDPSKHRSQDTFGMPGKSLVPSLPNPSNGGGTNGYIEGRSQEHSSSRRRTDSPPCSVTGTTASSRSVSPYTANSEHGNRNVATFPRYDPSDMANGGRSTLDKSSSSNHRSYSSSGGVKDRAISKNASSSNLTRIPNSDLDTSVPQGFQPMPANVYQNPPMMMLDQSQIQVPQGSPAAGQVLYMAVPSPDGRGQVLQPVQMMQLPGKPYAYVVPGNAGGFQPGPDQLGMPPPPTHTGGADLGGPHVANQYAIDTHGSGRVYGERGPEYAKPHQYQTDPAIAQLYASPQRPPLDALLGQIRRLSRDQVGCRLVQQALDEEGPMAASLILQEGLPFWGEAMVDPFGNYLFQKILEKVSAEERVMLIKNVSSRLVNASLNLHGTRSVQKIVEICAQDEMNGGLKGEETSAKILTASLTPAAARLCIDSHGNHVVQRILLRLGPVHSRFIFDAVATSVGDVARHRHGCCVIQRCLDSPPSPSRAYLVRCIVDKSLELMQDAYGNYVVQYVLDVCADEDIQAVCESVVGRVNLLAIQKFSSNVMEKCLERCNDRIKEHYLHEISDPERIRELMMDPFGNYVVQRGLSVATHSQAIRLVEAMRPHLISTQPAGPNGHRNGGVRNTAGGRRIIAKICRRFPNFSLNPVGTQDELYSQSQRIHQHQPHRYLNRHQQGGPSQHNNNLPSMSPGYNGAPGLGHFPQDQMGTNGLGHYSQEQMFPTQQPPQHYGLSGGIGGAPGVFYDPFNGGHGGYPPGM